jgi:uncharacterized protein (TIGR00255 family)
MLRSMTGFGSSSSTLADGLGVRVEARSVNHRHLVFKARVPDGLNELEPEIEKRVRARCERGAVTLHVALEQGGGGQRARLDVGAARAYQKELQRLADELGVAGELDIAALVALPGVLATPTGPGELPGLRKAVLQGVDQALEGMQAMRATEGKTLTADLRANAEALSKLAARIAKRMPTVVRGHRAGLERRVRELLGNKAVLQPGDLAREVALIADRLDVSEEITRLQSHLEQLESTLARGGRVGRRLDFLVQEILREVNTIGSKCSDAKVAHWVVDAKTHVERLREQVQNVE